MKHHPLNDSLVASLLALVLGTSVALACSAPRESCAERLVSWDLPPDLCSSYGRLEVLELPRTVDDLDWLRDGHLQELIVDGAQGLEEVGALPVSLLRLTLRDTGIEELTLPKNLETLDLRGSPISRLGRLPDGLVELTISNLPADRLGELPEGLRSLTLSNDEWFELHDMEALSRLQVLDELTLEGAGILSLEGIPPGVDRLSLKLRNVKLIRLPEDLRALTVVHPGNSGFDPSELPRFLEDLRLDSWRPPRGQNPARYVQHLELRDIRLGLLGDVSLTVEELTLYGRITSLPALPRTLESLKLSTAFLTPLPDLSELHALHRLSMSDYQDPELPRLPPNLRELSVYWADRLQTLGPGLESLVELDLYGVPSLGDDELVKAVPSLKRLSWEAYPETAPPELPPGLEEADFSNSQRLERLGSLPAGLTHLSVANATRLSQLPDPLPDHLRLLDVSGCTKLVELPMLPPKLETLIVSPGQLRSMADLPDSVTKLHFRIPSNQDSGQAR